MRIFFSLTSGFLILLLIYQIFNIVNLVEPIFVNETEKSIAFVVTYLVFCIAYSFFTKKSDVVEIGFDVLLIGLLMKVVAGKHTDNELVELTVSLGVGWLVCFAITTVIDALHIPKGRFGILYTTPNSP